MSLKISEILSLNSYPGKLIAIAVIILLSVLASAIVERLTRTRLANKIENVNSHTRTLSQVVKGLCDAAIVIFAIYCILRVLGFDVKGMLAGVGIAGIVIGFALQDLLKDIIAALGFIADSSFDVGDYVGIDAYKGRVVGFNLRRTTIHDGTQDIDIILNNREINKIERLTNVFSFKLPLPNSFSPNECDEIVSDIIPLIDSIIEVESTDNLGIQHFTDSTIVYKLRIHCDPMYRLPVTRTINRIVLDYYYEHGIRFIQKDVSIYSE